MLRRGFGKSSKSGVGPRPRSAQSGAPHNDLSNPISRMDIRGFRLYMKVNPVKKLRRTRNHTMPQPTRPSRSPASQDLSRRRFLTGAAAGAVALTFPVTRKVLGANETVSMGFIGVGGRGEHSADWFSKVAGVRIAAACDADAARTAKVVNANKDGGRKFPDAVGYDDMRRILDDKNIDAVCISTCNHWHALAAIWAMQAGKDVYCEKPVSQTVWEGRKMVEAARKYNRICQGGTQQRSDPVQTQIKDFIKSGKMGPMQWIRGNRFGVRDSIGKRDTPLPPPQGLNYDLWLGPAQDLPIFREKFHYDWHWVWNTGSGEMGNWGVHI